MLYFLVAFLALCRSFSSDLKLQHLKKASGRASLNASIEDKDPSISNLFLSVSIALFLFTNAYTRSIPTFECVVTNTRRATLSKAEIGSYLQVDFSFDISNTILSLFGTHPSFYFLV